MEKFIGTKIVQAEPMTRGDYIVQAQQFITKGMEDLKALGYKVVYEDGYESWSPKEVFEAAYRRTDGMNFGLAIEAAKMGKKITRAGWNGKGMWVAYRTGYPEGIPCNKNTADAVGIPEGSLFKVRPYLQMKCEDGSFQMWLASQSDILADDWYIADMDPELKTQNLTFHDAMAALRSGAGVKRSCWDGVLFLVEIDVKDLPEAALIRAANLEDDTALAMVLTNGTIKRWNPRPQDLWAKDWEVVDIPDGDEVEI